MCGSFSCKSWLVHPNITLPATLSPAETQGEIPVNLILAITAIAIVIYLVSCKFHPYMRCKTCNRGKESHSTTFKGAFGKCRACNGKGHHVRWGARFLGHKD